MKTLTNILAKVTTILGLPLIWHTIMPSSVCWMHSGQIAGAITLFLIFAISYGVCFLSLNDKI